MQKDVPQDSDAIPPNSLTEPIIVQSSDEEKLEYEDNDRNDTESIDADLFGEPEERG